MTDQREERGNGSAGPVSAARSGAALEAAFGRPSGVTDSFAPVRPRPVRSGPPPAPPSPGQREAYGRPGGVQDGFDPPPGALTDPRPAPESPWWKPDAPTDPWRDAGSAAYLGGPPDFGDHPDGQVDVPSGDPARRRRWRLRQVSLVATIVLGLGALLAGTAGGIVGYYAAAKLAPALLDPDATLTKVSPSVDRPPGSVADIAKRVLPAVVSVEVRSPSGSGTGSGIVIEGNGYILTNNHVVASAAASKGTLRAIFSDESSAPARIVGRDPKSDLAVLKVQKKGLTVAQLGDSDMLAVGDPVIAIGSPLGLAGTVTSGIVSALNRPVRLEGEGSDSDAVANAIQTDAAINPGNSGGALVDGTGAVIGINSAIATLSTGGRASGGNIGVGFAIPINEARKIAQQLIRTGRAQHATLGVQVASVTDGSRDGALVQAVNPGGSAANAGLREGDVITKVDDLLVTGADPLTVAIRAHDVGDVVTLTYIRVGATRHTSATLQSD
jgi:S1-C subfamily serine protease